MSGEACVCCGVDMGEDGDVGGVVNCVMRCGESSAVSDDGGVRNASGMEMSDDAGVSVGGVLFSIRVRGAVGDGNGGVGALNIFVLFWCFAVGVVDLMLLSMRVRGAVGEGVGG